LKYTTLYELSQSPSLQSALLVYANKWLNLAREKSKIDVLNLYKVIVIERKDSKKYYKVTCKICGWESQSEYPHFGFGGVLNCPECAKVKRNPTLEGCYGSVYEEVVYK
jgi:hypothetical protein